MTAPVRAALFSLMILAIASLPACGAEGSSEDQASPEARSAPAGASVVATWKDGAMTEDDMQAMIDRLPVKFRDLHETSQYQRNLARDYARGEMLYADGMAAGLDKDEEVAQAIENMRRYLVADKRKSQIRDFEIDDEEVKQYYENHRDEVKRVTVRFSRILVGSEEKARRVRSMLDDPDASFEEIVREHSEERPAISGGDVGYVKLRSLPAEQRSAVAKLTKVGEISPVVEVPGGYMIFKLAYRRLDSGASPLDPEKELKVYYDQVRKLLKAQRLKDRIEEYFKDLESRYDYQLNDTYFVRLEKKRQQAANPSAPKPAGAVPPGGKAGTLPPAKPQ